MLFAQRTQSNSHRVIRARVLDRGRADASKS